jgi:hypothetical protein
MPLTSKGREILSNLEKEYGSEKKAKQVLYAGENKGTFTGIHDDEELTPVGTVEDAAAWRRRMHDALDCMLDRHYTGR